jgi:hypothetical protein
MRNFLWNDNIHTQLVHLLACHPSFTNLFITHFCHFGMYNSSIYSSTFFIILESCTFHQFSHHPTLTSLSSICHIFIHGKLTNAFYITWWSLRPIIGWLVARGERHISFCGSFDRWCHWTLARRYSKATHISRCTQLDFDHTLNPNPKPGPQFP